LLPPQGLLTLDAIFEGSYSTTLQASGGRIVDMLQHCLGHHPASGIGPWLRHGPINGNNPIYMALCTRHLFETTASKLVADNPRVRFQFGASVTGLLFGEASCVHSAAAAADHVTEHKNVTGECFPGFIPCRRFLGLAPFSAAKPRICVGLMYVIS
jgi:hypothetical protein